MTAGRLNVGNIGHITHEMKQPLAALQNLDMIISLGETSKFTTESHKLLQGDIGELFLQFLQHVTKSHYYYL